MGNFVTPFDMIGASDAEQYGGKGANLGELTRAGFRVPRGFCLKADAYQYFLEKSGLEPRIRDLASNLVGRDLDGVTRITAQIQGLIIKTPIPPDVRADVADYYYLISPVSKATAVAVRSSNSALATGITSFPGMMDTFYYIQGEDSVLQTVKHCWASLWNTRAVMDRIHRGVDHFAMRIAPVIQEMIGADSAGVIFTANPVNQSRDEMAVDANWGLGESVVSGNRPTDFFLLDKASLSVKKRFINRKTHMVVWDESSGTGSRVVEIPPARADQPTLDDHQLKELGAVALRVESHYGGVPQDVEWAFQKGELFLLQTRKISTLK
ncbi:MAG: hypothetical protein KKB20_15600 [Proteobacteria bacterium]|nr:hypothetical protein [Pseudomonadota bacterium]